MASSSSAPETQCQLRTIARGGTVTVQHCAHCGAYALHLGPVTLRFERAALVSLVRTLSEALAASPPRTADRKVGRLVRSSGGSA
jgi:hypothetical protein